MSNLHQYSFEKLEVWQLGKDLVKEIYSVTKTFPPDERFGLVTQLNRAAISVVSTIAEGSARVSKKEQAYFSQIAYGSLMEIVCQLIIAEELGFIKLDKLKQLREKIEKISSKLNALRRYQVFKHKLNYSTTQRLNNSTHE